MRCFGITDLSELPPLPKDETTDENSAEQISLSDYEVKGAEAESEEPTEEKEAE